MPSFAGFLKSLTVGQARWSTRNRRLTWRRFPESQGQFILARLVWN